ncbi:hypothetical protein [Saccharibacter floricola]|uniref:Tetratricopeptide repeat protein n=1 Tax=Saccharibacter floricola DSM 15669 TaxID=1123227 RepID=A0ABQ0NWF4_9PROT|nr:hypothetical protein [Saccharibacter floricola]GBQ04859.1 hypothetical protein AA15669_0187 [Saccharibacter floricola DSM 15669]
MNKTYFFSLSALLMLGACSPQHQVWEDGQYSLAMDTGHTIFNRGHMGQAAIQYNRALQRALAANDAQGIHDAGYNLATAQLRQNKLDECLSTLDQVLAALSVRDWKRQEDLKLIRSYAFYGLKRWTSSEREARQALTSQDVETQEQAYTVLGLNAAATQDKALLQEAIEHLSHYKEARAKSNLLELQSHYYLMVHDWSNAATFTGNLTKMREEAGDYRAMRRALLLQSQAYDGLGEFDKAAKLRRQIQDSVQNDNAG